MRRTQKKAKAARGTNESEVLANLPADHSVPESYCKNKRRRTLWIVGNVLHGWWGTWFFVAAVLSLASKPSAAAEGPQSVVVGSKRFTESYILGEIIARVGAQHGLTTAHRQGLGNTGILEQALVSSAVDVYPEYTGTIVRELLKREGSPNLVELNQWLQPRRLKVAVPLGFSNTYALAMNEAKAQVLGIRRISDLFGSRGATVAIGLSHEFLQRADGWSALQIAYAAEQKKPVGLDHGLAYDALSIGRVDVIDVYSTDAQLVRPGVRVLEDDRHFFASYDAILLMRNDLDPAPWMTLVGAISNAQMIAMNAAVELQGQTFAQVADRFMAGDFKAEALPASFAASSHGERQTTNRSSLLSRIFADDFWRLTRQHLFLVFGSLMLAVGVGVPVGVAAWRWPRLAGPLLGAVAVLQTIPSLAMLAFLIAWVGGIGVVPAVIALLLYALLPIVRNTHAGLLGTPASLAQAALSLGLTPRQALLHVQLPLAAPTLLAGVKTAAVINVGTATMAAFIGAGGFGERIVAGLAVNDNIVMLAGALPAAALALLVQIVFDAAERRLLPGRIRS